MPIYAYKCENCGRESEEFRKIKERDETSLCDCGGSLRAIMSFSPKSGPRYPFVDNYMDHRPVEITSLSHYRRELKKRGLQEKGIRPGHKGQWI